MITVKEVEEELDKLGVPPYLLGYVYIVEAIMILDRGIRKQDFEGIKLESIYFEISKKYKQSRNSIERCIRFIHQRKKSKIVKILNSGEDIKMTNKKFLYILLNRVKEKKKV